MKHSYAEITDAVVSTTDYRPRGNGNFRCPAHDDKNASLSISAGRNGEVLLHCFAGCSFESIMDAIGLNGVKRPPADLGKSDRRKKSESTSPSLQQRFIAIWEVAHRCLSNHPDYRQQLEQDRGLYHEKWVLPKTGYLDPESCLELQRAGAIDLIEKYCDRWCFLATNTLGHPCGLKFHRSRSDHEPKSLMLPGSQVGLFQAGPWDDLGKPVVLVEGEFDCLSIAQTTGLPSMTGTGGAATVKEEWAKAVDSRPVILLGDNDEPGEAYVERWRSILSPLVSSGRIPSLRRATLPEGFKDASDCLQRDRSDLIRQAISTAVNVVIEPREEGTSGPDLVEKSEAREKQTPQVCPVSLSDLRALGLPPIDFLVDDLLPRPGFILFAGPPKQSKSWVAQQLAVSLASGTDFLSFFKVKQTPVLFLALENSQRQILDRFNKLKAPDTLPIRFIFPGEISAGEAGMFELGKLMDMVRPGLVIIDVLERLRGNQGRTGNVYSDDSIFYGALKLIADRTGTTILGVHHVSKAPRENRFDRISGSNGVYGSADGAWLIEKQNNTARLSVQGRDFPEAEFQLALEGNHWVCQGMREEVIQGQTQLAVGRLLSKVDGAMKPRSVFQELVDQGYENLTEAAVRSALGKLFRRGLLKKDQDQRYYWVGNGVSWD